MSIPTLPPIGSSPAAGAAPAQQAGGSGGFGEMLAGELGKLDSLQQQATTASQQLATGQAKDISTVAMEVEKASLALQLAVQVRNKVVDAYQELMRMQV